jgi:hypothetical protein
MEVTVMDVLPPSRRVPEVGERVSQGTVGVMVKSIGAEPAVRDQAIGMPSGEGFAPLRIEHGTVSDWAKGPDPEAPILEVASCGGGGGAAELPPPQP